MLSVIVYEKGGEPRRLSLDADELKVGREEGNDLVLDRANISKRHLLLRRIDGHIEALDLDSTNGTYINGRRVTEPRILRASDRIYLGDFVLAIEELPDDGKPGSTTSPPTEERWVRRRPQLDTALMTSARRCAPAGTESSVVDNMIARVLQTVLAAVRGLGPLLGAGPSEADHEEALAMIDALLFDLVESGELDATIDTVELRDRMISETLEFGPLGQLIQDPEVRGIHVVSSSSIRVMRRSEQLPEGEVEACDLRFSCDRALQLATIRLAQRAGQPVSTGQSVLRGRVGNGFLMESLLFGPAAPMLSLRRSAGDAANLGSLVHQNILSHAMREVLGLALVHHRRVLVTGNMSVDLERFLAVALVDVPESSRVTCISADGRLGSAVHGWSVLDRAETQALVEERPHPLHVLVRGGADMLVVDQVTGNEARFVVDCLLGATKGVLAGMWGYDSLHAVERLALQGVREASAPPRLLRSLGARVDLVVRLEASPDYQPLRVAEIGEPMVDPNGNLTIRPLFRMARRQQGWERLLPPGEVPRFCRELVDEGIVLPANFLVTP